MKTKRNFLSLTLEHILEQGINKLILKELDTLDRYFRLLQAIGSLSQLLNSIAVS